MGVCGRRERDENGSKWGSCVNASESQVGPVEDGVRYALGEYCRVDMDGLDVWRLRESTDVGIA
jgi:hypothetical protein